MNCIIVDDEAPARNELSYLVKTYSEIIVEKEFEKATEALAYINSNKVDIAFLDVEMPNMNGVDLGKAISTINKDIKIIFVTAYKNYAYDAFEIDAFDYILKPIATHKIIALLEKLSNEKPSEAIACEKISLNEGDKIVLCNIEDIVYIEANSRQSKIITVDGEHITNNSFNSIIEKLPENFFKCHRSYCINLNKIKEVEPWFNNTYVIKFDNVNAEITVSRSKVKEFKKLIGLK